MNDWNCQIWECVNCGGPRVYGNGPHEHNHAVISCNGSCHKATPHIWRRNAPVYGQELFGPKAMTKAERRY